MQVAKPGTSILSNIAPIQNSLGDNNLVLPKNNKKKCIFNCCCQLLALGEQRDDIQLPTGVASMLRVLSRS